MIKVLVIANKFKYLQPAKEFFEKLLKSDKIKIHIVTPSKKDYPSNITEDGQKIISFLRKNPSYFKVLLSLHGEQMNSQEFANKIIKNHENIIFVIGGPRGIDENLLLEHINLKLSLSKLTFNHLLSTTILLEQIYRALNILKGGSYHH